MRNPTLGAYNWVVAHCKEAFHLWDTTTIGNMARLIVSYPDSKVKEAAKRKIEEYIEWYNS